MSPIRGGVDLCYEILARVPHDTLYYFDIINHRTRQRIQFLWTMDYINFKQIFHFFNNFHCSFHPSTLNFLDFEPNTTLNKMNYHSILNKYK